MESYEQCEQGRSYCSLYTLDNIHRPFFVTRLIINTINKVQRVDFKLENVLVSLHSLKTMGLGPFGASAPLFLWNGELLGHSPIRKLYTVKAISFVDSNLGNWVKFYCEGFFHVNKSAQYSIIVFITNWSLMPIGHLIYQLYRLFGSTWYFGLHSSPQMAVCVSHVLYSHFLNIIGRLLYCFCKVLFEDAVQNVIVVKAQYKRPAIGNQSCYKCRPISSLFQDKVLLYAYSNWQCVSIWKSIKHVTVFTA